MREKNLKRGTFLNFLYIIPKFPIHYYTKIAAKTGTHDKIILLFASKRGTVPPKEEQLASMIVAPLHEFNFKSGSRSSANTLLLVVARKWQQRSTLSVKNSLYT